jgi:hypothetical protein
MISDNENRVLEAARQCGPLEAYRRLIAENNALIQGADLNNGRAITTMRTAIHTALAGQWAEEQHGLRVFLSGIWTLAGKTFIHSDNVYRTLEEPRDLEAYDFLLRIRAWVHFCRSRSGRPDALGNHPADDLSQCRRLAGAGAGGFGAFL